MTIDFADHFRQQLVDLSDGRDEFKLPRVSDFALGGRSAFATSAVGRVVSG